jgi:hypothetical protein
MQLLATPSLRAQCHPRSTCATSLAAWGSATRRLWHCLAPTHLAVLGPTAQAGVSVQCICWHYIYMVCSKHIRAASGRYLKATRESQFNMMTCVLARGGNQKGDPLTNHQLWEVHSQTSRGTRGTCAVHVVAQQTVCRTPARPRHSWLPAGCLSLHTTSEYS